MFGQLSPALPLQLPFAGDFPRLKTYAAYPVWKDSTMDQVKFQPLPRRQAVRLYHDARRFDRRTHQPGQHGGAVGRSALHVLHALLFDFLNHATGRLDPSRAAIARMANVSLATAGRALARLKALGMLNWLRRCSSSMQDGRFVLEQETNAYAVLPASQWRGYSPPEAPPAPEAGTWGDHPSLPRALDQAAEDQRLGLSRDAVLATLASDPTDLAAMRLASLGRTMQAREVQEAQAQLQRVRERFLAAQITKTP